ncbi:TIGR03943 family putative permease subunit [Paenibacillus fonticola]|uniref:TIGR03943 family putative permease subunit n=1 Tax=Paenibacillus fonticola TaxID=379896 RepID=UPI0003817DC4|nr:TIGR03943 family protein [Paenibacillus fonticola]
MKNEKLITLLHYIIRTIILLALSVYIAYLVETGSLQLYIGERIMPLVKLSALVVYALAVIQGFIAYRSYKGAIIECDCCGSSPSNSWPKASFLYGVIALPLLLGFFLPDTVLGGSFASKKGIILSSSASPYAALGFQPQQNEAAFDPSDAQWAPPSSNDTEETGETDSSTSAESLDQLFYADNDFDRDLAELAKRIYKLPMIEVKPEIYMEILSSIVTFKEHFIGKSIEISGFVYREPDLADDQLVIGRIAVQCCTADATPYGVLAEFVGASELKDDTWVKVKGTIGETEYNGNTIIKIDVAESSMINVPDPPYIYPNFDFLNVSIP